MMSILGSQLGSIDELLTDVSTSKKTGEPLRIPLGSIQPDPDQPRKEFDQKQLQELADSIKYRGVIQPIIVKPVTSDGIHIIVAGERRWRASVMANGVNDIPVIVRENSSDDDQVIENIQRENLAPMEIGQWILKQTEQGREGKDIARMLGKTNDYVSRHKQLPTLPPVIMALYTDDIVRSYRSLTDLSKSFIKHTSEVTKFCGKIRRAGGATMSEINAFLKELKQSAEKSETSNDGAESEPKAGQGKAVTPPAEKTNHHVFVSTRSGGKVGELMTDRASEGEQVAVKFPDSVAMMDMDSLIIVEVV